MALSNLKVGLVMGRGDLEGARAEFPVNGGVGDEEFGARFSGRQTFSVRKFNGLMLDKFLRLARDNHIPVYWVTLPVPPAVYQSREPYDFDEHYHAFLADVQNRYGVTVVQKDFIVYDNQSFRDSLHMNHPAAERFTQYLGGKLAAAQKAGTLQ